MEIRGYSSSIDGILGLTSSASDAEVASAAQTHLVVRVQEQDRNLRAVEDFLSGKVPERDANIHLLLHKLVF
jgi:hypothetical protein